MSADTDQDPRLDEKALVERMLAGDEPAMEELADEYFPRLYRFALARLDGDSELTREIVQTTVCKALAKLETWRGEAALFTWLCACCQNEIRMHFRRRKGAPKLVEIEDDGYPDRADGARGAEGDLERKEAARLVHAALDLLPPHYARALEWKYVESLPVQEIAERLHLKIKAAESLLTRARQAFRDVYDRVSRRTGVVVAMPRPEGKVTP